MEYVVYMAITNCTFQNSYTSSKGGAIYIDALESPFLFDGVWASNITSEDEGGLIYKVMPVYPNHNCSSLSSENLTYPYID